MEADETTLSKCLFFTANRLANVLRRIVNNVYAETGISTPHIYLLIVVNQHPGITISELSRKLDIAPSTCTRFVDSLAKQNMMEKVKKWKTVHLSLTPLGRKKSERIDNCLRRMHEQCAEIIGEDEYQSLSASMWKNADKLGKV